MKDKKKLKEYLVYSAMVIAFLAFIFYLYQPIFAETSEEGGLNCELPTASSNDKQKDKMELYELSYESKIKKEQDQELDALSAYIDSRKAVRESEQEVPASSIKEVVAGFSEETSQLQEQQESYFNQDPASYYDPEKEELKRKLQELKDQQELLLQQKEQKAELDRIKAENEQLSQRLLADIQEPRNESFVRQPQYYQQQRQASLSVEKANSSVVSSLAPQRDSVANAFHSYSRTGESPLEANTLKAVVDRTTCLKDGDYVSLRLLENSRIGKFHLKKNSPLIARASIGNKRLSLTISSIEINGHIFAVNLKAFDLDGQEGVYIPNSDEISAIKEMTANISSQMGTSMTLNTNAKTALVTELTKGVMKGASSLAQKKLREVKVTLKSGYRLFLIDQKSLKY